MRRRGRLTAEEREDGVLMGLQLSRAGQDSQASTTTMHRPLWHWPQGVYRPCTAHVPPMYPCDHVWTCLG